MENKCWKEKGMKHTHLHRWTRAIGKWMIPRHKWSPRYQIAHGWKVWVWICLQGTWELMKQNEPRSNFIIIFLLLFYSLSFSISFFLLLFSLTFLFFSSFFYIFLFCSSELLQHNTYLAFVRDDVVTPPPCLNNAHPQA
jgi:hypothetical protein